MKGTKIFKESNFNLFCGHCHRGGDNMVLSINFTDYVVKIGCKICKRIAISHFPPEFNTPEICNKQFEEAMNEEYSQ